MNIFNTIGIMSGTSLDGLDIAYCTFRENNHGWDFRIEHATTLKYSNEFRNKLANAWKLNTIDFLQFHNEFGTFIGKKVNQFIKTRELNVDFISSHGHTIFHTPKSKFTFQIGNGAFIAAETGITTISDFRTFNVALGGQGAPLVPIGDLLLFKNYDYCLNLGGFSNISFQKQNKRIAYDICPVNIAINHYAKQKGREYDKNGNIAKRGKVNIDLLENLNNLPYYAQKAPKSLGKEWLDKVFLPEVEKFDISIEDKLRTIYEHAAMQIGKVLIYKKKKVLITGGGAFNDFFIETLKEYSNSQIIIPNTFLIEYKEALIFAFLGVLRITNQENCLKSVTGSSIDNIGGVIHRI